MPSVSASSSHSHELGDTFAGAVCEEGVLTIAGFGSLLSETSARSTFPELQNFRLGKVHGYRRVFAHACNIFFERGIANLHTREVSSLSVEECPGMETVVTLFEIKATEDAIAAFIQREHEFRFLAVRPSAFFDHAVESRRTAVICGRNTDENYRKTRCPPEEWERRYGKHGLTTIWGGDVLPCRVYLRHCTLAAQKLGPEVEHNFLDCTVLADRETTVREWLTKFPEILDELPPASLIGRYSG